MKNSNITSLDDFLDEQYGKAGTAQRDELDQGYEAFKLGVKIREARKKANMTQQELAERSHTKRSYISRIENDASDIRVSTLLRIIQQGLNGKVRINIDL